MDTSLLEPMTAADLVAGATLDRRHLDGGMLGDLHAQDVQLLECVVSDCQAGECRLAGLHASGTTVLGSSFVTLAAPGAVVLSGRLEGVRIGALLMDDADVSIYRVVSSRIDVVSLRNAKVRRLEIVDSQLGLLDLTGSRVSEVTVTGGSIAELSPSRGSQDGLDVSATSLGRILDPAALRGVVLSEGQAMALGPDLAAHLGARVVG